MYHRFLSISSGALHGSALSLGGYPSWIHLEQLAAASGLVGIELIAALMYTNYYLYEMEKKSRL